MTSAWPSGRRNVMAGAVCVRTVGWMGSMMTAVSALAYCSLKDGNSDDPVEANADCNETTELSVADRGVEKTSSVVL